MDRALTILSSWQMVVLLTGVLLSGGWSAHAFMTPSKADIQQLQEAVLTRPPLNERVTVTEATIRELSQKSDFNTCALIELSKNNSVEPCRYLLPDHLNREIDNLGGD